MVSKDRKQGTPASQSAGSQTPPVDKKPPAAGAHAASHLTNEDATPGTGILSGDAHHRGREVDSGAG